MEDLYRFSMTLCPDFLTVLCAGGGAPGGVVGEMLTETSVQGVNCCWKCNFAVNSHGWSVGWLVDLSVCNDFLKEREVSLPCSY